MGHIQKALSSRSNRFKFIGECKVEEDGFKSGTYEEFIRIIKIEIPEYEKDRFIKSLDLHSYSEYKTMIDIRHARSFPPEVNHFTISFHSDVPINIANGLMVYITNKLIEANYI
jgi:hypothetical protein